MADTVKLPGIKQPLPKWGVWGGLGGVLVLIAIYWRNHRNTQAAAARAGADTTGLASGGLLPGSTATPGDTFPWDGTYGNPSDPYSMDTSTGQTYGNESGLGAGVFPPVDSSGQAPGPPFA